MKFRKTDYIAILILIATLIQLVIIYPSLPQQVVTNWGTNGNVTYGPKSTIWQLWIINALLFPGFFIIPKIDPRGKNYSKVDGFYAGFRIIMVVFLSGMLELVIFTAEDAHRFDVIKIGMIAVSLLMIFIGNYLPKCKQTYTFGIKTMWTYADERVWNDTHRFGGIVFVVAGVVMLVSTIVFTENINFIITLIAVLGAVIMTTIYSYLSYKKYNG